LVGAYVTNIAEALEEEFGYEPNVQKLLTQADSPEVVVLSEAANSTTNRETQLYELAIILNDRQVIALEMRH